ncbi:MAG: TraR/DksA C4-type zinc finger protein [Planctomycetales bacterium]|nr:TraR/DksA C4-type zinc finger protein [Planctomycetales bacterium]
MNRSDEQLIWLVCPACDWRTLCDANQLIARLRQVGMLRREAEPSPELIQSLREDARHRMACDKCRYEGLTFESYVDDWEDAPHGKPCAVCGTMIPAERLEVFPDTTTCTACQRQADQGVDVAADQPEFCQNCGSVMELRKSTTGVTRYRMVCRQCGR